MPRSRPADFLVEIGTEELPPKALKALMEAFADNLRAGLDSARLAHDDVEAYASPRRLAVFVTRLATVQPDRQVELKGPPVSVAFDGDGAPRAAALAFARKCNVDVSRLEREQSDKGEWLVYRSKETGDAAEELLPAIVEQALHDLPIPRRMRWGASEVEFVRPVHWLVMLHGKQVVKGEVLGLQAGNRTRGHRFLAPGDLTVGSPGQYLSVLENKGYVIADFAARRRKIVAAVDEAARQIGGSAGGGVELFDEVTALTEWPVAITGSFDEQFLALPREVIVATLTGHQRYFPVRGKGGELLPAFVAIANIESREPQRVRHGNERVIRPRLADASFFWDADRRTPLIDRVQALDEVVYQQGLGSLADKSRRVATIGAEIARQADIDADTVARAAVLAKGDLLTGMVGEFPELQGIMGRYYAAADGEPEAVATAIGEQYLPRFAGDRLPEHAAGQALAIADKLDTLAGSYALGRKSAGNRDPFGLRRAALGVVRIVVEQQLDLNLDALLRIAIDVQPVAVNLQRELADELYDFIIERMRAWYVERPEISVEMFEAVKAKRPSSLLDFDERLKAVAEFVKLDEAASLAAANKRIANILRQADFRTPALQSSLLRDPAELDLHAALTHAQADIQPLLARHAYTEALTGLAGLRAPVDRFFDEVLVMTDDDALKNNRLSLLAELRDAFLGIADISRLSIA